MKQNIHYICRTGNVAYLMGLALLGISCNSLVLQSKMLPQTSFTQANDASASSSAKKVETGDTKEYLDPQASNFIVQQIRADKNKDWLTALASKVNVLYDQIRESEKTLDKFEIKTDSEWHYSTILALWMQVKVCTKVYECLFTQVPKDSLDSQHYRDALKHLENFEKQFSLEQRLARWDEIYGYYWQGIPDWWTHSQERVESLLNKLNNPNQWEEMLDNPLCFGYVRK